MVEIKPGAELDRAVAEAIGLKATHKVLCGGYYFVRPGDEMEAFPVKFAPSVDLNAAFFAAEKAFDCRLPDRTSAKKDYDPERRRWIVERVTDDEGNATRYRCALEVFNDEDYYVSWWQEEVEAFADTASLAICATILELANGEQS